MTVVAALVISQVATFHPAQGGAPAANRGDGVAEGPRVAPFAVYCYKGRRQIAVKVKRVVANVAVSATPAAKHFYQDILGLDVLMDMGWIVTYGSRQTMPVQISVMSEGGSGAPVPDLSIEVDNLDAALVRVKKAKIPIEYGPVDEPWGVRRFFVRDPFGKLVNILVHNE